ncbi:MAG: M1 family metallopeptidase [Bdellovibrio sp.]
MVRSKAQALNKLLLVVSLLFFLLVTLQAHAQTLTHKMDVELLPSLQMIKVQDTIRFPKGSPRKVSFLLHKALNVAVISPNDSLSLLHPASQSEAYAEYGLTLDNQDDSVSLAFSGMIFGFISTDGVLLNGNTYWYPTFLGTQKKFEISIKTPGDWRAFTQGQLTNLEVNNDVTLTRYTEIYPQDEIFLVSGPFKTYSSALPDGKNMQVFLRRDEATLAQNLLTALPTYLAHYSETIAPYPFPSFSVLENIGNIGYVMPGFTLQSRAALRSPLALMTSLPHEVLHNWWGHSVYVDYDQGNWSEGLTTYMADYWMAEKSGAGRDYRLNTLATFADFVHGHPENDIALKNFRGRHQPASHPVGNGKAMMFFHMLERRVGTDNFKKALQDFYAKNIYKQASFADLQSSFEKVTKDSLEVFFSQWTNEKGLLDLELTDAKLMRWIDGSFAISIALTQKQTFLYDVQVPVVINFEDGSVRTYTVNLKTANQTNAFVSNVRPVQIALDPDFHLFRKLAPQERPAILSSLFSSSSVHFFADPRQLGAVKFIKVWRKALKGNVSSHTIDEVLAIPDEGDLVFLGDDQAFTEFVKSELAQQKFELTEATMRINNEEFLLSESSTVLMTHLKGRPHQTLTWIRWSPDMSPEQWAHRLVAYGNFGVLVFKGDTVVLKTTWPVRSSSLQKAF